MFAEKEAQIKLNGSKIRTEEEKQQEAERDEGGIFSSLGNKFNSLLGKEDNDKEKKAPKIVIDEPNEEDKQD